MNEEFQKELLEILRTIKDGTPETFQMLLDQRITYLWACIGVNAVGAIISGILVWLFLRMFQKSQSDDCVSDQEAKEMISVIGSILFAVILLATLVVAITNLPDAIAPLGKVLGGLSK